MIASLSHLFNWRCRLEPDALAYAFVRDTLELAESLSYAQLHAQVHALGAQIAAHSKPGDRVLLVYPAGLDFARAFWACMLTGRIAVPVPAPDPVRFKNSASRLQAIIEDAQATLVLTTTELLEPARAFFADLGDATAAWQATDEPLAPDPAALAGLDTLDAHAATLGPQTVAYLQYTSGSTGAPRGVVLTHANVLAQCRSACSANGIRTGTSRMLCWLPHYHDYGLGFGLIAPFHTGVPGYLMSPVTFLRRPLRWLEAVGRFGITHTGGPNFAYAACTKALAQQPDWSGRLDTLVSSSCGAEPIQDKTATDFTRAFAPQGLRASVFSPAYGMAEAVLVVTATAPELAFQLLTLDADALTQHRVQVGASMGSDVGTGTAGRARTVVGCGKPIAEMRVEIVHPQTRRVCAADAVGEIWVQGSSVGQGYWRQPNVSADVFGAHLADGNGPFLRTGDLGFMHDGELYVTGRIKDLIIVRGRNLAPQDIEWTVQRTDSSLRAGYGAAFSVDTVDGEALVVVQELERRGHEADLMPMIRAIRKAVAAEHELPVHAVALVRSGSVPRTSSGKIRRQHCRQDYLDGNLQVLQMEVAQTLDALDDTPWTAEDFSTPLRAMQRSDQRLRAIEQTLVQGVARFARRAPQDIALDASAIECGLDSLSSFRLLQVLESALGCALPPACVMGEPSLHAVARRLDRLLDDPAPLAAPVAVVAPEQRRGLLPLSATRQRMCFRHELAPGAALHNVPVALELLGPLDPHILQDCLHALIQRHEVLRTRWVASDGQHRQRIESMHDWRMRQVVLEGTASSSASKQQQYQALAAQEALHAFDLTCEPAMRATLVTLGPQDHRLLWTLHHSVCDGWSMGLLMDELCLLYGGRSQGLPVKLPKPELQYLDCAAWEARFLDGGVRERELAYWTRQLADAPSALALPTDHRRPAQRSFRGATVPLHFSERQLDGLRALAKRTDTTLFMAVLAVWQTLLHRHSGQAAVVTGSVIANRQRREFEGVVGCFANTLALRSDFDDGLTVEALLAQVKATALAAYEHRHVPFEEVVEALQWPHDLNRHPLVQTLVMLRPPTQGERRFGAGRARITTPQSPVAKFDLSLELQEVDSRLEGWLNYDTALFERETALRMAGHLQSLVNAMCADAGQAVARLPLLSDAERRLILTDWNDTVRPYALDVGVQTLIERQVQRTPLAVAAAFRDRQLSYRELNDQANRLAHRLRQLGVGPDVCVGVCMERSIELVVGLLAVLKAGGAFVPLDPELPFERLAHMLDDTAAPVVLTQSHLVGRVPDADDADGPKARRLLCLDAWLAEAPTQDAGNPVCLSGPEHLAYVIYTSGSTGNPKGVMVPHRALANHALWSQESFALGRGDRVLQKTTISFDAAVSDFFIPLLAGATIVLAPPGEHRDIGALMRTLRDERITLVVLVPSQLRLLLDEPGLPACVHLRHVMSGGEALSLELAAQFQRLLPNTTLGNFYGPSETTIDSTHCAVERGSRGGFGISATVPIGRPIANAQCYVLDAQRQPVPVGVTGELYIGGAGLARGYLNRPALTAERFVPHPFPTQASTQGQRVYRTGDQVRWLPDGQLEYLGRADFQVKIRGIRIELGEIEAALNAQPGVQHCVVAAREDQPGLQRLVAYVVGRKVDAAELKRGLKQTLAEALIPTAFVLLPHLPTLPNGKVDRHALPEPERPTSNTNRVEPRTPVEHSLWDIWRDVLHLEQFGVHDNFFELGGHSLLATQVVSRMRAILGAELPLRALFEAPSIAGLAVAVERQRQAALGAGLAELPAITPVPRGGLLPTSFSQRRMWLVQQFNPETTAYNLPFAVRLRGPLDRSALIDAMHTLVARHEAFRTTLVAVAGEPLQNIVPTAQTDIEHLDLSALPEPTRMPAARQAVQERGIRPFDLARGPLHRPTLLRLDAQDHVLFWSIHHAIGDGWSTSILLREFATLYRARLRGQQPSLPPMAVGFADYASWQRRVMNTGALAGQLAFWKRKLAGLEPLALPFDRQRRGANNGRGARLTASFQPPTLNALKALTVKHGATPYMALLACFKLLLARHCGVTDVAVGTPIANRTHMASEHLVGALVNTVVVRTDLAGDPSFADLLTRVRENALQAYAHQDLPFDALVEALAVPRSDGSAPLVQVLFNMLNAPQGPSRVDEIAYEPFEFDTGSSQFDLELTIDTELSWQAQLSYSTEVFAPATGLRFLTSFLSLVDQVLADPQAPISSFTLIGGEDLRLLAGWNDTAMAVPPAEVVHAALRRQAERTPDRVALRCGAKCLTHAELQARAHQLTHALRQRGVGRGQLVGLCLPRGADMVVAQLAILASGATYVPLDPAYPTERLVYMAQDAGLALLLSNSSLAPRLHWPAEWSLLLDADEAFIASQPAASPAPNPALDAQPEDPAYVIYTSGSTGRPKGVVVPHRAIVNFLTSMAREPGLAANDVLVAVSTLSFDIAVLELLLPLSVGAELVLAGRDEVLDGRALRVLLESSRATAMQATPSTWRMLVDAGWQGGSAFKALIGGEALPQDLAQQLLARAELWNLYGPTETTVWSTCWKVSSAEQGIRIGRPIANTQVHVLDERGQHCPIGVAGEIFIGGNGVALGYLDQPDLTAQRFVADPFNPAPGARLYRTADRGRWCHDGLLEHLGRLDFQVKLRGHRIELGEIETTLAGHPQVARAVVIVREDRPGDQRLVAYVVAQAGVPTAAALREHLRASLPEYMLPQHFVSIDAVPLLPNGKTDRTGLPIPDMTTATAQPTHDAPQTPAEKAIAQVWQELLGVTHVGRSDNFFDLGGHSLLAVRAVSEVERRWRIELDLRRLVHESLAQIAATPRTPDASPEAGAPAPMLAEPQPPPTGGLKRVLRAVRELIGG